MKWRYAIAPLVMLTVVVVSALATRTIRPKEPVYAGQRLSQWLDSGFEPASIALREIGPAAVPYLFARLRREDPDYGSWQRYRAFQQKMPKMLQRMLPEPGLGSFDQVKTHDLLLVVGPPALPSLADGLRDRNPAVRIVSAWALGSFLPVRTNLSWALPWLIESLEDENPEVRQRAAWALSQMGSHARTALPSLYAELSRAPDWLQPHLTNAVERIELETATEAVRSGPAKLR